MLKSGHDSTAFAVMQVFWRGRMLHGTSRAVLAGMIRVAGTLLRKGAPELLPRLISCTSTVTVTPHPLRSRPRDRTMNLMSREFRYWGEHFFLPNSTNVTKRWSGVVTEADILYINRNTITCPAIAATEPAATKCLSLGRTMLVTMQA
jgi:hypothetical protein